MSYIILVTSLFFSPIASAVWPTQGDGPTYIAACTFVFFCHWFRTHSWLKVIVPVVLFVFVMPTIILIAIFRPVSPSWREAAELFYTHCTFNVWLSLTLPAALAGSLHYALLQISAFRRQRDGLRMQK